MAVRVAVALLNVFTRLARLRPLADQVAFVSRIADEPTLDFRLVATQIRRTQPSTRILMLCRQLRPGLRGMIRYGFHLVRQVWHVATSRVVVLDSYCLAVSAVSARHGQYVLQMWHALGAFKRFGRSILDRDEAGTAFTSLAPDTLADYLHMHRNYTMIAISYAGGIPFFAEAFGADPAVFTVAPLPRVDLITNPEVVARLRERIRRAHPELGGSARVVLVAPTFRRGGRTSARADEVMRALVDAGYVVIPKVHRLAECMEPPPGVTRVDDFTAVQLLAVADAVVTDYSSILLEACLADVPVYFYVPDLDRYDEDRGFYTPPSEFPGPLCGTIDELLDRLAEPVGDRARLRQFADRFIARRSGNTAAMADLIVGWLAPRKAGP